MKGLCVVVVTVTLAGGATASSTRPRQDGRILFVPLATSTEYAPHAIIRAIDPATGRTTTIAPATIDTENPAPSPDGRRLAFTRGLLEGRPSSARGLYVADANGRHARRIASTAGYSPTWSPDNSRLAYVWGRVMIMRADGSPVRRLPLDDVWQVAWSPRGSQLVISRGADAPSLQLVRPDGRGLRMLRRAPRGEAFLNPKWAPDGRRIVYEHEYGCAGGKCGGGGSIEIVDLQGHVLQTIAGGYYPAWSPSGTRLAYATGDGVVARTLADGSTRVLYRGGLETAGIGWQAR